MDKFDCSKGQVNRLLSKFHGTGTMDRMIGSGRPKKTTHRQDRIILRSMHKNRFITASTIKENLGLNV